MVNDAGILSQITNNAHALLRHFLFNAVLNSALCMIAILISVGVVVLISQHRRNLIFSKKESKNQIFLSMLDKRHGVW